MRYPSTGPIGNGAQEIAIQTPFCAAARAERNLPGGIFVYFFETKLLPIHPRNRELGEVLRMFCGDSVVLVRLLAQLISVTFVSFAGSALKRNAAGVARRERLTVADVGWCGWKFRSTRCHQSGRPIGQSNLKLGVRCCRQNDVSAFRSDCLYYLGRVVQSDVTALWPFFRPTYPIVLFFVFI
jgi:hypothetical protein